MKKKTVQKRSSIAAGVGHCRKPRLNKVQFVTYLVLLGYIPIEALGRVWAYPREEALKGGMKSVSWDSVRRWEAKRMWDCVK